MSNVTGQSRDWGYRSSPFRSGMPSVKPSVVDAWSPQYLLSQLILFFIGKINNQSIIPSTDVRTGCRNVSHCQQQQSYSGLRSPGRSNSTYFWNDSWVQTFHNIYRMFRIRISRVTYRHGSEKSTCIPGKRFSCKNLPPPPTSQPVDVRTH